MNVYLKNIALAFLALFMITILTGHPTFAGSSTQLGSTHSLPPEETTLDSSTAQTIALYSTIGGYTSYNYYGSETTCSNICLAADGMGNSGSVVFYIGHGWAGYPWNPIEKQWAIYEDTGEMAFDKDIFPYSSNQNVRFAFLYCCKGGDEIGNIHFWSGTPFEMPYAWLHTISISDNGYSSPDSGDQAFIGFHELAPWLADSNEAHDYQGFITEFYYAALCCGEDLSVNEALDYAAKEYNPNCDTFADTDLYKGIYHLEPSGWVFDGQMKVYGNGNIHLSNSIPSCAMKTKTNGYFYLPSGPPPQYVGVQIALLFTDGGIAGDQIGGEPPYTLYTGPYPDELVDICDALLINGKYGKSEGQSGWEYMADIVPDRVIDMYDALTIGRNYGRSGTYSHDLSHVTVAFYFEGRLLEEMVDPRGFAYLPYGPDFTVKRSGMPIGAMVIFWSRV